MVKKTYLLLDQFSSHRSDQIILKNKLKIKIYILYIPIGLTHKYQPLDVSINGILKQKAKSLWRSDVINDPDIKITNEDAVKNFLLAFNEITSDVICKSFTFSCFHKIIK